MLKINRKKHRKQVKDANLKRTEKDMDTLDIDFIDIHKSSEPDEIAGHIINSDASIASDNIDMRTIELNIEHIEPFADYVFEVNVNTEEAEEAEELPHSTPPPPTDLSLVHKNTLITNIPTNSPSNICSAHFAKVIYTQASTDELKYFDHVVNRSACPTAYIHPTQWPPPLKLIDPATGELTVVQQNNDGQYVPIVSDEQQTPIQIQPDLQTPKRPKHIPDSRKIHVLSNVKIVPLKIVDFSRQLRSHKAIIAPTAANVPVQSHSLKSHVMKQQKQQTVVNKKSTLLPQSMQLSERIIDLDLMKRMNLMVNYWLKKYNRCDWVELVPVQIKGDGNCLLNAVNMAIHHAQDDDLSLRKDLYDFMIANNNELFQTYCRYQAKVNHGVFQLSDEQLAKEWEDIVKDTKPIEGQWQKSLEPIHIYALANMLRKTIIVFAKKFLFDARGLPTSPVDFGGIYVPNISDQIGSKREPILLAYELGHFQTLFVNSRCKSLNADQMPITRIKESANDGTEYKYVKDVDDVECMPLHFTEINSDVCTDKSMVPGLKDYLDVKVVCFETFIYLDLNGK